MQDRDSKILVRPEGIVSSFIYALIFTSFSS